MSFLRDLLDAEEPLFSISLKQLEQASGNHGCDAKLIGDIHTQAQAAMKHLGLDGGDTTGPELYHALIALVKRHDAHLARSIGGTDNEEVRSLLPLIKQAVERAHLPRGCWVLKKSVAKSMLRETPPPHIMERLGYRSADSMLKRENLAEIYGALRFAEDPAWLKRFNDHYKTLTPSDFEAREIEIIIMPQERWGNIAEHFIQKKRHNVTHLKELGVIMLLPVQQRMLPGITLWATSLLFHYINEIRLYSAFFKLQQVKKDFGAIFADTLNADPDLGPIMAGQRVHWRVIQRYFGKLEDESHPEIFEPHVQPEDLHWRKAEESLYKIDPELGFWRDLDYVGLMFDDRPVTFNMMDVAAAYCNETPYAQRVIYHFRESLWNEIFMRYMGRKTLEDQVLRQLDNDMVAPEALHSTV